VRAEIRRLFDWLKQKGLTTIITAERDQPDRLTRHGIEEFVSDCVILLDHRIREEISTRRLRIVKYRGSTHGTNEYPFLIDAQGISVLPISSLVPSQRRWGSSCLCGKGESVTATHLQESHRRRQCQNYF